MKRSHNNIFVDLEARVEDGEDVEGEEAEDGYGASTLIFQLENIHLRLVSRRFLGR